MTVPIIEQWVNLLEVSDEEEVRKLLEYCIFAGGDEDRSRRILQQYHEDADMRMIGVRVGGRLAGLAGFKVVSARSAILQHIAVHSDLRSRGIGQRLVQRCLEESGTDVLTAETDADAIQFYVKLGFSIRSLGEKYPGVERFRCSLECH